MTILLKKGNPVQPKMSYSVLTENFYIISSLLITDFLVRDNFPFPLYLTENFHITQQESSVFSTSFLVRVNLHFPLQNFLYCTSS